MTEVVEVYADDKIVVRQDAKALARAEAAARAAAEIGMHNLAVQDMERIKTRTGLDWCEAQGLVALSAEDRRLWCTFMPTGYYSDWRLAIRDEVGHTRELDRYQYADGVPMHVRALMKTVRPIMSTLEIRTVETTPRARIRHSLGTSFCPTASARSTSWRVGASRTRTSSATSRTSRRY